MWNNGREEKGEIGRWKHDKRPAENENGMRGNYLDSTACLNVWQILIHSINLIDLSLGPVVRSACAFIT